MRRRRSVLRLPRRSRHRPGIKLVGSRRAIRQRRGRDSPDRISLWRPVGIIWRCLLRDIAGGGRVDRRLGGGRGGGGGRRGRLWCRPRWRRRESRGWGISLLCGRLLLRGVGRRRCEGLDVLVSGLALGKTETGGRTKEEALEFGGAVDVRVLRIWL